MSVKQGLPKIFFIFIAIFVLTLPFCAFSQEVNDADTVLPYPFKDQPAFGSYTQDTSSIYMGSPNNLKYIVEYDAVLGQYVFYEKVGSLNYRLPQSMSLEDYIDYDFNQSVKEYWLTRTQQESTDSRGGLIPKLTVGGEAFNRIFGGNTINIVPQGYVEVSFGYQVNKTDNPSISENLRSVPTFDFDEKIQMNVTGQIGTKMNMKVNYNTEATFDYENQIKMEYTGEEDEILRSIQAGNVSMPLNGTLITGASNLFGMKAEMQFGKLNFTAMVAQVKGETTTVETEDGAEVTSFDIDATDYDKNKHFFLSQYFRDNYETWVKNPAVLRSNITISKIEVWVTNKSGDYTDSRNILALQDLGEHDPHIYNEWSEFQDNGGTKYPKNAANGLYESLSNTYSDCRTVSKITKTMSQFGDAFSGGVDFEKIEQARLLSSSEYTVNEKLGYISLSSALNADEVLAVAYTYTVGGQTFKVGEFSTDGIDAPKVLYLKLLKGTNLSPGKPTWDLMMKNVYSLNAYSLSEDDFELNVMYQNDSTGSYVKYLTSGSLKGHILLNVMGCDVLNSNQDKKSDGVFDYVEDVTVNPETGRVFFPVLEPFGSHLADSLANDTEIEKFCFQSLYDSTLTYAEQDEEHNKFKLTGSFKGSSTSDISLGTFNVAQGSVTVTAGGQVLTENIDYTVDYTMGTVKIINEALLASGTSIEVSTESEELFSTESKTLLGGHANYEVSDKLNIGGTLLWMHERPLTEKVDYGDDPISNVMLGADASYTTESGFLTKALNALPFYNTTAKSAFTLEGEYAKLIPGTSGEVNGNVYIDDFESTKTSIDLRTKSAWSIASTPQHQTSLFPEGDLTDELDYGVNRAKLAFYTIDPLFLRNNSYTPSHIKNNPDMQSSFFVYQVYEQDLFPDREYDTGESTLISVLNLAYYPEERGQYNFDDGTSNYSAGINSDGTLKDPASRWGGIMREMTTTDFESANIEYIEFWVMDPFIEDTTGEMTGGDLYFNLGEVSEDVLKDSRKSFESGLPTAADDLDDIDTTIWGRVSTLQSVTNTFSNSSSARKYQDVGFDGLTDDDEQDFYSTYLENLRMRVSDDAYEEAEEDPSSDDYHYYRGSDYDTEKLGILSRYKKYNGTEGNSPTSSMSSESYTTSATTTPDIEDINDDNTLNEYERYYQYKVSIRPEDLVVGENYINDMVTDDVTFKNGETGTVNWYQFKIPISSPDATIGSISDFSSIRFMRMFMRNFDQPVILRFATLDLVRATWREYTGDLADDGSAVSAAEAEVSAVSIEENASRDPVNYVLPPGVSRVIDPASTSLAQLDEQSMTLKVTDLGEGDSRAAYKPVNMDFRRYHTLKMFVHAEALEGYDLDDDDLKFFIRIGSDYKNNYYEYELPLKVTPAGDYSNSSTTDREAVWPEDNEIEISLDDLVDLKLERNKKINADSASLSDIYAITDDNYSYDDETDESTIRQFKVKGNPNLGDVEVFMIGVHNTKKNPDRGVKSVEVWADELRLSDFDNEGGWAANIRTTASLGDLGSVSVALSKQTSGFGSISSGINDREMDDISEINVAASVDWGRFFPDKMGIKIPMYYNYYKSVTDPKYNPLDPDVTMEEALEQLDTKAERDSLKSIAQTVEENKTISFTNVKVEPQRKSSKTHVWDPENFAVSYTYNETSEHDANTVSDIERTHNLTFSYNFSKKPKLIQPFKKVKLLQKGPLKLLGDFNFYPYPSQISYRSNFYRYYNETQTRNVSDASVTIPATYDKEFYWYRYLDIDYDLTRSLSLTFSSSNTAIIDEPDGRIDRDDDDYEVKKDSIISNILSGGRPTLYSHTITGSYRVPFRSFKPLNFMSGTLRYTGTYEWDAGSETDDETINIGNTVTNSNSITATANANLQTLFNKVPYFKKVNQKFRSTGRSYSSSRSGSSSKSRNQPLKKNEAQTFSKKLKLKEGEVQKINHKLSTKIVKVIVTDKKRTKCSGKS
jgi:cell surface protein SprA